MTTATNGGGDATASDDEGPQYTTPLHPPVKRLARSMSQAAALAQIEVLSQDEGYCYATNPPLARELDISLRQVRNLLTGLEEDGLIRRTGRGRARRIYPLRESWWRDYFEDDEPPEWLDEGAPPRPPSEDQTRKDASAPNSEGNFRPTRKDSSDHPEGCFRATRKDASALVGSSGKVEATTELERDSSVSEETDGRRAKRRSPVRRSSLEEEGSSSPSPDQGATGPQRQKTRDALEVT